MTANKPNIIAEAEAVVSLQGDIIRSRVPSTIIEAAGGEDKDSIAWNVQDLGQGPIIVGSVVKGGAEAVKANRTPPTPPAKAAGASKKGAKKAAVPDDFASMFAEDDDGDEEDDSPVAPAAPVKKTVAPVVAPPVAAASKAGGKKFKGPIPKPSQQKARKGGGNVAYEVPE